MAVSYQGRTVRSVLGERLTKANLRIVKVNGTVVMVFVV